MLTMADDEDAREQTIAEVERLFSEGRLTFEGDHRTRDGADRRLIVAVALAPRCGQGERRRPRVDVLKLDRLAWPDGLVAAVERWLAEGGEPPEVLRG